MMARVDRSRSVIIIIIIIIYMTSTRHRPSTMNHHDARGLSTICSLDNRSDELLMRSFEFIWMVQHEEIHEYQKRYNRLTLSPTYDSWTYNPPFYSYFSWDCAIGTLARSNFIIFYYSSSYIDSWIIFSYFLIFFF